MWWRAETVGRGSSKRYRAATEKIDSSKSYALREAIEILRDWEGVKFDESVDLAINLGVDPKHADQMVRGALVLPHGVGKDTRVLVFAKGEKEKEAQEAGADYVGGEDLAKRIQEEGWLEFDRVIATPDMMSVVGRLGKILGPRGIMPNPKLGTVTMEVGNAVREHKAGKVEYRVDKAGIIHVSIGKRSFEVDKLVENASTLINVVIKAKPAASKGTYLKKISVSTTMGPGIRIDPASVAAVA
jgi:large subunit ribosomal protein L1